MMVPAFVRCVRACVPACAACVLRAACCVLRAACWRAQSAAKKRPEAAGVKMFGVSLEDAMTRQQARRTPHAARRTLRAARRTPRALQLLCGARARRRRACKGKTQDVRLRLQKLYPAATIPFVVDLLCGELNNVGANATEGIFRCDAVLRRVIG